MDKTLVSLPFVPTSGIHSIGNYKGELLAVGSVAGTYAVLCLWSGDTGADRSILVAVLGQTVTQANAKFIGTAGGIAVFEV